MRTIVSEPPQLEEREGGRIREREGEGEGKRKARGGRQRGGRTGEGRWLRKHKSGKAY